MSFKINTKEFRRAVSRFLDVTERGTDDVMLEIATRVKVGILQKTPIDRNRLFTSWVGPTRQAAGQYRIANDRPYALVVEYGGYPGVGPKTVKLGPRDLGHGFTANSGIYSTQAPHGMVRRTLAQETEGIAERISEMHKKHWGKT